MSRYYSGWAPYVPVAERRRDAERVMAKLRKAGHPVAPVTITGRQIATTFWGRAWCDAMEGFHDYESRLPRGRTYVRNGSVVDLQIAPGKVTAMVSGSELYNVAVTIKEAAKAQWRAICADCAGGIDSLVELLQGRFSKGVMERLCRQQGGLFPRPSEIRFSCSCPDHASMCKHVAAVLYGVGARLDQKPDLLFRLRAVDETELLAGIESAVPLSKTGPGAGKVLEADDISALFGLDMAQAEMPAAGKPSEPGKPPARRAATTKATTDRKAPATPNVAKHAPAAAKANASKSSAPRRAAAAARPIVPEKDVVTSRARTKGQAPVEARERPGGHARARAASVAIADASAPPAQDRGRRSAANAAAESARKSKPKPVKWW
jgi:uncharacterized Zn finger protein